MDDVAEAYVRLVLALGEHDPGYVDAYYGPAEWQQEAKSEGKSVDVITAEARSLVEELSRRQPPEDHELLVLRHRYLTRQLEALIARAEMLAGRRMSFDEESQALYDAVAPVRTAADFEHALSRLDSLLPGEGPLAGRVEEFRAAYVVPPGQLDAVFQAAIKEARHRTRAHIELPENESFEIEYVSDKPWSGYNWYKGNAHSLIQVNVDLPIYIDRAVDLACHEGYPGHHVYNTLLEEHLVRQRGWVEFSVYPLYSPQSLIAEGSANFGIEVAFPGETRTQFEKVVLFPLAGIDPEGAERYYEMLDILNGLDYAGNEAARRYINGEFTREQAAQWLETYALMSPERAAKRVQFIDTYRSYVINYNLGQDLVRDYINGRGGTAGQPERRWEEFKALLASPRLPSDLR